MYFGIYAFNTDTFQCVILYQKEGYLILYPVYNRFRVMLDFVRDPNKFQIL